jgi:hypothetical protein
MDLKQKIIGAVIAIGVILFAIFKFGLGGAPTPVADQQINQPIPAGEIRLIGTNPPELLEKKEIIIIPTQTIEFTFNERLENAPETRIVLDPVADVEIKISDDKKSAKIIPTKPYKLGQGFTVFIKGETKFEGGKKLDRDYDFHFNTINYSGI